MQKETLHTLSNHLKKLKKQHNLTNDQCVFLSALYQSVRKSDYSAPINSVKLRRLYEQSYSDVMKSLIEKGLIDLIEKRLYLQFSSSDDSSLVHPWDDPQWHQTWNSWKIYRRDEHKANYKSLQSEQAALTQISNLAKGDVEYAIQAIHITMSNQWKGFVHGFNEVARQRTNTDTYSRSGQNQRGFRGFE